MGVVGTAKPHWDGQWSLNESDAGDLSGSITYQVEVDSNEDGPAVARTASGLPARHSAYSVGNDSITNMYCTSRNNWRRQSKDALIWLVDCHFSTLTDRPRDENGNPTDDPTQWKTEYSIIWVQRQKEITKARFVRWSDGRTEHPLRLLQNGPDPKLGPIINSAGEPVEPTPMMDDSRMHIRAVFHEAISDIDRYGTYKDAINSDTFTITKTDIANNQRILWSKTFLPGQGKMVRADLAGVEIAGASYSRISLEVAFDPDGWNKKYPDKGRAARRCPPDEIDAADPNGVGSALSTTDIVSGMSRQGAILDVLGNNAGAQVMLDGNGQPLACGADPIDGEWAPHDELPFSILGI